MEYLLPGGEAGWNSGCCTRLYDALLTKLDVARVESMGLVQSWYEEALGLDGSPRPPDRAMPDVWDAPPGSTS